MAPIGIAVDSEGTVYLLDQFDGRVKVLKRLAQEERAARVEESFNNAEQWRSEGKLSEAIAAYTEVIRLYRNHLGAYYGRGRALQSGGEHELALKDFSAALELAPNDADIYYYRGQSNLWIYPDIAVKDFSEVLRLDPENADAFYSRARAHQNTENHETAVSDFDNAISLGREDAYIFYSRGYSYQELGDYEGALDDYTEAVTLDEQLADAFGSRATIYTLLGRDADARLDIEKALSLGANRHRLEKFIEKIKGER